MGKKFPFQTSGFLAAIHLQRPFQTKLLGLKILLGIQMKLPDTEPGFCWTSYSPSEKKQGKLSSEIGSFLTHSLTVYSQFNNLSTLHIKYNLQFTYSCNVVIQLIQVFNYVAPTEIVSLMFLSH